MKGKIVIKDCISGIVLQTMGVMVYDNTSRAIQQCETWYSADIEQYETAGRVVEIVIIEDKIR